jgi:hypothetical protein
VMTMAGQSGGKFTSTSLVASVPPVDAPKKMIFSVDRRPRLATGAVVRGLQRTWLGIARHTACRGRRWQAAQVRFGCDTNFVSDVVGQQLQTVCHAHFWFGHKINCTEFECPQRDIRASFCERGHHDHGHRAQAHQFG